MNATKQRGTWIVTISLLAIAGVYLQFIWLPGHRAIKELGEQVETKRAFVSRSTGLSASLIHSRNELEKSKTLVEEWEKNAPGKREIPALYSRIDALAEKAKLRIERFDPQASVQHEVLQEIPIYISCKGTFHQIYDFIQGLENLQPTIWIESLKIQKQLKDGQNAGGEISMVIFSDNS